MSHLVDHFFNQSAVKNKDHQIVIMEMSSEGGLFRCTWQLIIHLTKTPLGLRGVRHVWLQPNQTKLIDLELYHPVGQINVKIPLPYRCALTIIGILFNFFPPLYSHMDRFSSASAKSSYPSCRLYMTDDVGTRMFL